MICDGGGASWRQVRGKVSPAKGCQGLFAARLPVVDWAPAPATPLPDAPMPGPPARLSDLLLSPVLARRLDPYFDSRSIPGQPPARNAPSHLPPDTPSPRPRALRARLFPAGARMPRIAWTRAIMAHAWLTKPWPGADLPVLRNAASLTGPSPRSPVPRSTRPPLSMLPRHPHRRSPTAQSPDLRPVLPTSCPPTPIPPPARPAGALFFRRAHNSQDRMDQSHHAACVVNKALARADLPVLRNAASLTGPSRRRPTSRSTRLLLSILAPTPTPALPDGPIPRPPARLSDPVALSAPQPASSILTSTPLQPLPAPRPQRPQPPAPDTPSPRPRALRARSSSGGRTDS